MSVSTNELSLRYLTKYEYKLMQFSTQFKRRKRIEVSRIQNVSSNATQQGNQYIQSDLDLQVNKSILFDLDGHQV